MDMNLYISKALELEADFGRRAKENSAARPFQDPSQPKGVLTVPADELFLPGENIAVKLHVVKTAEDGTPSPRRPFLHRHDFFEFNYVYTGTVENHLEDEILCQGHEKILLMNPFAIHDPQVHSKGTVLFNILVKRQWVEEVFVSILSFNEIFFNFFLDSVYGLNRLKPYLVFNSTADLSGILDRIIQEYFDRNICYQQVLFSKLIELFAGFTRLQQDDRRRQDREFLQTRDISGILGFIKNNYTTATLASVAESFGYSTSYLSKLIKKHTGLNFTDILHDLKLQSACNYLIHSDLTVEKINEIIGYNDTSYFSKVFRKKYGLSPSSYRQKYASRE